MRRPVESAKREMRLENFRLNGSSGTPVLVEGQFRASVTDNGVGDYTLTFSEPFARVPTVALASLTSAVDLYVSSVSTTAVRIAGLDATDGATPAEFDCCVHVMGADVVDEQ